jgi:multiple sugar transport system substrate-binding protein
MAALMQAETRRLAHDYTAALAAGSNGWRHALVEREAVWSKAIERIVTEGITPEQAVDEAAARTKQILSE